MNLNDWTPLKFVNLDLLNKVKLAYVFGKTGQEAFIITEDDDVFACGPNFSGCLGLEHEGSKMNPVLVPELCQKKVKGFTSSIRKDGAFMCAYTSDRRLYYWGRGIENDDFFKKPILSAKTEFGKLVSEVAAGPNHCCILTVYGEVFSFGCNQYGQLGRSSYENLSSETYRPGLVEGGLKGRIVVTVSCGANFSVAVVHNGEVFAWGRNNYGQLGVGFKGAATLTNPTQVLVQNIKKIMCGEFHVLAVNGDRKLYSWGRNNVGQLGSGNGYQPRIVEKIGRVIDIAASCYGSTTAAMTENRDVYMWGACGEFKLTEPTKTEFPTMFHVFAFFGNPRIMYRPMIQQKAMQMNLENESTSIRNAFENVETCDLTVVAEGKEILVHKLVLKLRSPYFKELLKEPGFKKNQKVLTLDQNYEAMYAYFKYIYSGKLEASSTVAFELWKIANQYYDFFLKEQCENCLKEAITVQNVTQVYDAASKLGAEDLASHCISFASKHIGDVVETPGCLEWYLQTAKNSDN